MQAYLVFIYFKESKHLYHMLVLNLFQNNSFILLVLFLLRNSSV